MLTAVRDAVDLLPTLRTNSAQWVRCAYTEIVDPKFGKTDGNSLERYRFLIALQYACEPGDEPLVRYLFDQEVVARSNDSFQGFGEALRLASYLLSRFKRCGDFWRLAEAKFANFDTLCGFEQEYLFAVGYDAALSEFAASEHVLKEQARVHLFDEAGDCLFTPEEIDDWEKALVASFPRQPEDDPPLVWIERTIALQSHEEGRALLDELAKSEADVSLAELAYMQAQLGDRAGAVETRRTMLAQSDDDWSCVSETCSLAELLVDDSRSDDAWATLRPCEEFLYRIAGWNKVGLGRSVVEVAFRVAKSASPDIAHEAFRWACSLEPRLETSTFRILTLAAEAATTLGDSAKVAHYEAAARTEQARIDEMLKK